MSSSPARNVRPSALAERVRERGHVGSEDDLVGTASSEERRGQNTCALDDRVGSAAREKATVDVGVGLGEIRRNRALDLARNLRAGRVVKVGDGLSTHT